MSRSDITIRAKHAHGFMTAAEIVNEFSEDVGDSTISNVVTSLCVLAAIAASDAICGLSIGKRASGESHTDAVTVLSTATINGKEYAKDLRRLLAVKSNAEYSAEMVSMETATNSVKWARRLIDGMETELHGPTGS
jgi:hypothetical protein